MKKIYLKDRNSNWKEFDYKLLSELADEFKTRNITIEAGATIGAMAKKRKEKAHLLTLSHFSLFSVPC